MKRNRFWVAFGMLLFLVSCNKKEANYMEEVSAPPPPPLKTAQQATQPAERPQAPAPQRPSQRPGDAHSDIPDLSGAQIVVPASVKGKWKAVKFMLEDKTTNQITEHTAAIGEEWAVPDSNIKVKVGEFLPDLIIQGTVFTSVTNELKNPAVRVVISENGQELFKGWLFSLFPTMHPFQHPRFAITLKDVVSA